MPESLPAELDRLWHFPLPGKFLGGLAANEQLVIVGGRDLIDQADVFTALDVASGQLLWQVFQPCHGNLDYGNAPRATPVIADHRALLLGAFGHLHCVDVQTGVVLWRRSLQEDFGASLPTWGFCGSPLVIGQRVIVQPGSGHASLVCLDLATGDVLWQTPGRDVSYSSFIHVDVAGVSQVIGYDAQRLGGWNLETGEKLWELEPRHQGDFNVGTPLSDGQSLWVATENNGARRYRFNDDGHLDDQPVAEQAELSPDTQTPLIVGERMVGIWNGLHCLDRDSLQTIWFVDDPALSSYASMIGFDNRVLFLGREGDLVLIDVGGDAPRELGRTRLAQEMQDIQSHPALVNERLIVRIADGVACFSLR